MAEAQEKPLHDLLSHSMVDIYVGAENTHWILHEKLLCTRSKFFNKIFYSGYKNVGSGNKTFGLPDEEAEPFRLFVGWLYSGHVPSPEEESDLGNLFELYLMAEKWQVAALVKEVLDSVRRWYRTSDTYPGLRRVQYIYANTDTESPMRQLLVSSVARQLVTEDMPPHWQKALRKNGQLAVDLIRTIMLWRLDPESVPDAREEPSELEREKVEEVERAEERQEGIPKGEQREGNGDAAAGKDSQHLVNGLSNGVSHDDDEN